MVLGLSGGLLLVVVGAGVAVVLGGAGHLNFMYFVVILCSNSKF